MPTTVNVGTTADKPIQACGLVNLGHTCYMNATLQCLRSVAELRCALRQYSGPNVTLAHHLTVALHTLFGEMDDTMSREPPVVKPTNILNVLRDASEELRNKDVHGNFMQQDAEECWSLIIDALSQTLNVETTQLFGIKLKNRVHCPETGEESSEEAYCFLLQCHITDKVNNLLQGLKLGLQTQLEKWSVRLRKNATHQKDSKIIELPQYLSIHFLASFWNNELDIPEKIKQKVEFPIVLDVSDFCCDDLKASSEVSLYELVAVVVHEGMTAMCGHYVAWVKDHADKWVEMDDERVIEKKEADLLTLSGGGSGKMAYLCIYKKSKTPKTQPKVQQFKDVILPNTQNHTHYGQSNKYQYHHPNNKSYILFKKRSNKYYFNTIINNTHTNTYNTNNTYNSYNTYSTPGNTYNTYKTDNNNYFKFDTPPRDSASRSDYMTFLSFCVFGVLAFVTMLDSVIPEGFIGNHKPVLRMVMLTLGIGLACGFGFSAYLISTRIRSKVPTWVKKMLPVVCGVSTYIAFALWFTEVLAEAFRARIVCWMFFIVAPFILWCWWWWWFYKRKEKEKEEEHKSDMEAALLNRN